MPLPIIGALTILVAAILAAFAISSYQGSREMVTLMTTPPATWNLPASPELFIRRSALSDGVLLVSACSSAAGVGMLLAEVLANLSLDGRSSRAPSIPMGDRRAARRLSLSSAWYLWSDRGL